MIECLRRTDLPGIHGYIRIARYVPFINFCQYQAYIKKRITDVFVSEEIKAAVLSYPGGGRTRNVA